MGALQSMEPEPEPAQDDASRKRPLEEEGEAAEGEAKRPMLAEGAEDLALKVLVSNSDAGAVIGKGGSVITSIQQDSQCKVKMSQNADFFPGTQDRIILITGSTFDAVYQALSLIVAKLAPAAEGEAETEEPSMVLKIPVPNSAAGGIIGKGGATIRTISETSGARVQLSQKDEVHAELNERLCTVTGTTEQVLAASRSVVEKVQEGDCRYSNMSTNYAGLGGMQQQAMGGMGGMGMYGAPGADYMQHAAAFFGYQQPRMPPQAAQAQAQMGGGGYAPSGQMTMSVPDAVVGAVVGKGGS